MSFCFEGDGSWQNTKVWKDGVLIEDCVTCEICINANKCVASINYEEESLERILLLGVYKLIGDGAFSNTKLFINDEMLRGVISVIIFIKKHANPRMIIETVFLPNLVELEGEERKDATV